MPEITSRQHGKRTKSEQKRGKARKTEKAATSLWHTAAHPVNAELGSVLEQVNVSQLECGEVHIAEHIVYSFQILI